MKYFPLLVKVSSCLICISCSYQNNQTQAIAKVTEFHQQVNAGKYEEIYNESSGSLKEKSTKESFVNLLQSIHNKLGNASTTGFNSCSVSTGTDGVSITLVYNTVFIRGSGIERFVYRIEHQHVLLSGYWLRSNDLIQN